YEPEYVAPEPEKEDFSVEILVSGDTYYVKGEWLIKLINRTDFDSYESLQYFQKFLREKGVIQALEDAGIDEGDTVNIYDVEFDFLF
ncbi:MAG: Obg family GTPase CgtA, partial [Clostridia bacterium]|nr:Obg family GTPase CgtA [Clostridia bacterium]